MERPPLGAAALFLSCKSAPREEASRGALEEIEDIASKITIAGARYRKEIEKLSEN
jgi:hypothetical protein